MKKHVSQESFNVAFAKLALDSNSELDFRKFLDFMRLLREIDGIFVEDLHKLAMHVKSLETRVLRRALEYFRFSRTYIQAIPTQELIDIFCDLFDIDPDDNIQERLHVKNLGELYDAVQNRDEVM